MTALSVSVEAAPAPVLSLHGITKRFPGVVALDQVDLDLQSGEVHALAGENGAGKSSLIKILGGIYAPDAGEMRLAGTPFRPSTPQDAIRRGIRVVHQEFSLLPHLTVAENILFERLPRRWMGFVDRRRLNGRARELLDMVGLEDVSPASRVEQLGVAHQQLVEIARALSSDSRVLILDEPTATLTPREAGRLFEIIHRLKAAGVTVVFISHHLEEIFDHCDRVTVLRNGRRIATNPVSATSPSELVRMMVGRELASQERRPPSSSASGAEALRIEHLRYRGAPKGQGVSFALRYGEIVGIAGLVGSGRTELVRAIFGADKAASGTIFRDGRPVSVRSPKEAIRHGICLVTENRKEEGLVLPMTIQANVTLANLAAVSRMGFLDTQAERTLTERYTKELDIRMASQRQAVRNLSGGNQQKVVLAKWLSRAPKVLILDEPTRGIDVGAKAELYALLGRMAEQGLALLVVSSDLPELISLCDRILVLSRGQLAGEVARADYSEEAILKLAYREYMKTGRDG